MIYLKLKILIPYVATTSIIRQDMYDIKFLWLTGSIFVLKIGLIFQYIQPTTVKELVYQVYFHLKYNFYYTGTKKVPLSENINNLWLISDVLSNKCGFCVFP